MEDIFFVLPVTNSMGEYSPFAKYSFLIFLNFISTQVGLDRGETGYREQSGTIFPLPLKTGMDLSNTHKTGRRKDGQVCSS